MRALQQIGRRCAACTKSAGVHDVRSWLARTSQTPGGRQRRGHQSVRLAAGSLPVPISRMASASNHSIQAGLSSLLACSHKCCTQAARASLSAPLNTSSGCTVELLDTGRRAFRYSIGFPVRQLTQAALSSRACSRCAYLRSVCRHAFHSC